MFILQYKLLFSLCLYLCLYCCVFVLLPFFGEKKDLYVNMGTEFNKETDSAVSEIVFFSDR